MRFKPLDPEDTVRRYRRNLPHWRQPGATYFVTFRTADSIPQRRLKKWEDQRNLWLQLHPFPWSMADWNDYHALRFEQLDHWLDLNSGRCLLARKKIAELVVGSMRHFDGYRHSLDDFVVMPNHVHALVTPFEGHRLDQILHSWKSFSSHQINSILRRSGAFWMDENYDRIVRDWEELNRIRDYIQSNPKKAKLLRGQYILGTGSGIDL